MARPAANIQIAAQRMQEAVAALEQSASGERHHMSAELVANIVADCARILDNMDQMAMSQESGGGRSTVDADAVKRVRERCVCHIITKEEPDEESASAEEAGEQKGRVATEPPQ